MASTISVKSTVQTPSHNYRAQDITDYSTFLYFSDSQSILKLDGPLATLYNNTSFVSPDFNYPGILTKDINIPLVSGSIPMGDYTLTTTTRIIRASIPVSSVNLGTNSFRLPLTLSGNFGGATSIVWTGGANAGTYTINSVTDDGFNTIVTVVESLASTSTTGSVGYTETVVTVNEYTLCYQAPTANLLLPYNCATAILEWDDNTNYAITCEGSSILPSSQSLEIVIESPFNEAGSHVYPTTTTSSPTGATTQLWTGAWIGTLTNDLVYILPSGLYLEATITGSTSVNVNCDATLCCMSTCIINATNTFTNAVASTSNLNTIQQALVQYTKILGAFMRYSIGVSCGNTTIITNAVTDMETYLAGTGCCNDCSESGQSTQVVALYNVIVSGNTLIVEEGDIYINISQAVVGDVTTATFTLDTTQIENLINSYIAANPSIVTDIVDDMRLRVSISSVVATPVDVSVRFNGVTAIGSPIITGVVLAAGIDTQDILVGDPLYHSTFPEGIYILSIAANGDITCNDNFISNGAVTNVIIGSRTGGLATARVKRTLTGVAGYNYYTVVLPANSLELSGGAVQLLNDENNPGNIQVYGTDNGGTKGWQDLLTLMGVYVECETVAAQSITNVAATYLTISLPAGTWIVEGWGAFTTGGRNVVMALKNGATTIATGIQESLASQTMSVVYKYTSGSAITLNLVLNGVGGSVVGDYLSLKATRIA